MPVLFQRTALAGFMLVAASWIPAAAAAQSPQNGDDGPVAASMRTSTPPTIDGVPDETAWLGAPAISGFVQHEPFEGQPATERTEIRVLFDDTAVYFGAWMFDRDPSGILTGENRRDADLRDADALLIVLDTYLDRQNGFVFGTTPAGIEYDGQVVRNGDQGISSSSLRAQGGAGAGGGFNLNWDGSWEVATSVDSEGWYAEFRIPFSTLRYGAGTEQTWGLNISRTVRRTNEEDFWAPVPRQFTLHRVANAGTLRNIQAPTRRTLQVTPYALSSASRDFIADTSAWDAEFGGDAKIGLTPALNLDLTYNTDFAQVEVDEQQINLTRFSLFFPEKRPFFLENAGTFTVGIPRAGSDLGMDLFYSRRIGIGDDGELVPIVGGGRITGKVGGFTMGLLDIQTERLSTSGIPANNYSVGRLIRELPNRSQVGGMLINRINTENTGDHNVTYSVDGRLGIGESTNLDLWFAGTHTPNLGGREHSIGLTGSYRTRDWDLGLQYREVGENFNPEVGFLPRAGFRGIVGRVQRQLRIPSAPWLRELRPHILLRDFFGFDGFNQTRYFHFDNAVTFTNGSLLSTAMNVRREGLQEPFDIADSVTIGTGTYDFVEGVLRYNTDQSAMWSLAGVITVGGFFSGHRKSFETTVTNRLGTTWTAALRFIYNDVDLAEGSFDNTVGSLRLAYSFTPRIFLQSLFQYNSETDSFSGNVRLGWLNTAGTGLYVVFNQLQQTIEPTGPLDRALVVKYTHQFGLVQ